ncbi:MAG: phosphodiester glycosidase family protein [Bacteroidota bacterium]|nr:phosphodiester glycosidase family protein [Bacteroidota bacterium]
MTAHVLLVDLSRGDLGVRVGKALENIAGLERVYETIHRYDSLRSSCVVLGGVNANFWAAGTNHPIGPTVIEGVILKNKKYKNWSAIAFGTDKSITIDTFNLVVSLRTPYGILPVATFNERLDSTSVVVYTPYYGTSVPFVDISAILLASADTVTDDLEGGNGVTALIDSVWSVSPEGGTLKAQFEYMTPPLANSLVPCRVTLVDTGFVPIPRNGGVLSFGRGAFPMFFSVMVGDTFTLESRLKPTVPVPVREMVSGSPRLLRNGQVSIEWQEEGLRKPRFVTHDYARTAIGISRDRRILILVTVEPPDRRARKRGASLETLAELLRIYGASDGFNLDGGSSATMVVLGETVSPPRGNRLSRKVSTVLMVVKMVTGL